MGAMADTIEEATTVTRRYRHGGHPGKAHPVTDSPDNQKWLDYVDHLLDLYGLTTAQFTARIGSHKTMISHWRNGTIPGPDKLREIADEFGRPIAELFVAAGYAKPEEVGLSGAPVATEPSDIELYKMVNNRLAQLIAKEGKPRPTDPVVAEDDSAEDEVGTVRTARRTKAESKVSTVRTRAQGRVGK